MTALRQWLAGAAVALTILAAALWKAFSAGKNAAKARENADILRRATEANRVRDTTDHSEEAERHDPNNRDRRG